MVNSCMCEITYIALMGSTVEMLLWTWILLDSGVTSVSLPEITDGGFIDECVREHNRARSSVNPPASNMLHMTWDEGLAFTARAWSRHCASEHNTHLQDVRRVHPTFASVGENIWTGSPSLFNVTRAIKRWVDEKAHYDYQGNDCRSVCGHYTQVVWGSSYKVGCAAQLCPNGVRNFDTREGVVFVCNYATAGNMNAERPYESDGEACSGCEGSCVDRLCRYSWTPDMDQALPAADHHYVYILVVRPICLILTFIASYAVHCFYPDVFCYERSWVHRWSPQFLGLGFSHSILDGLDVQLAIYRSCDSQNMSKSYYYNAKFQKHLVCFHRNACFFTSTFNGLLHQRLLFRRDESFVPFFLLLGQGLRLFHLRQEQ
uniref:4Fe-4S ferredoxin-type domain-containing protein n=2 Tax=Scophthalmus maximus TaxID=52904 RepID=A0A8D3CR68_SCOMX